jgi:single-strand DNA-binding protein
MTYFTSKGGTVMNYQTVTGNVTRDAEYDETGPNSTPRLRFSVADNEPGPQEHTDFFNCVIWGDRAAKLASMITKGRRVAVGGRNRSFKKEDGTYSWSIRVDTFEFQDKKPQADQTPY